MEASILGVCPSKKGPQTVPLFGYSSKGHPSIEILGIGKQAKIMKEKFVYLSKIRQLPFPRRHIVLCLEVNDGHDFDIEWLELPLLLLFWHLTDHICVLGLSDCMASGKVSIHGKIDLFPFSSQQIKVWTAQQESNGQLLKIIDLKQSDVKNPPHYVIPLSGILEKIPQLYYETFLPPPPLGNSFQNL